MKMASVWILFVLIGSIGCKSDIGTGGKNDTDSCPLWMVFDNSTLQCRCIFENTSRIRCHGDVSIEIMETYCLSYDEARHSPVASRCPYSYHQQEYAKNLSSSVAPDEFNEVMCGPLNRQGLFCSKCKPGYDIPVFSKVVDECVKCDSRFAWPLYLALVLIPITVFYIVVIIFNFSATHPPITAYIFYCQFFSQIVSPYNMRFIRHSFEAHTNNAFLYLTWTVCDIWNLDMLRYVIPGFCLDQHFVNKDALFLELITAFYPILLIFLTIVIIEMHASNFRVMVFLWKPFHKCFSSFRRTWDPRSSIINAFATFLLLSSFKVCFLAFTFSDSARVYGHGIDDLVLYVEPSTMHRDLFKQPYFTPFLILTITLVIFPTFLLCLYPTKVCKIATQHVCSIRWRNCVFLFMDAFQGHYRNGTNGGCDYRSISVVGFVLRFLVCILLGYTWSRSPARTNLFLKDVSIVLIFVSLFYAHVRPCRKQYMNVIESLLYMTIVVLLIVMSRDLKGRNKHYRIHFHICLAVILIPSLVFIGVLTYKLMLVLGVVRRLKNTIANRRVRGGNSESPEADPHRLTHPTQYTPLLHEK